jgi:hypothetical protein
VLVISCLKQKAKLPPNSLPLFLSIWNTQPISHFTCPRSQHFAGYQLVKEHKNEGKVSEHSLQRNEIFSRFKRVLNSFLFKWSRSHGSVEHPNAERGSRFYTSKFYTERENAHNYNNNKIIKDNDNSMVTNFMEQSLS